MLLEMSNALKHQGDSYSFRLEGSLAPDSLPDGVKITEPVVLDGTMTALKNEVALLGTLSFSLTASCALCLTPIERSLSVDYDEVLVRMGLKDQESESDSQEDEILDAVHFEGTSCDLTHSVREAVLLQLPMRFLCQEDCKGLCPVCGVNLNEATCGHHTAGESPFAILKQMRFDQEEEV